MALDQKKFLIQQLIQQFINATNDFETRVASANEPMTLNDALESLELGFEAVRLASGLVLSLADLWEDLIPLSDADVYEAVLEVANRMS